MWNEMTDVPAVAPVTAMVAAPAAASTIAPAAAMIRFDSLRMNRSSLSLARLSLARRVLSREHQGRTSTAAVLPVVTCG
jgi:hypothetical protein